MNKGGYIIMNEYEENNIDWYEEEIVNESRIEKSANIVN